MSIQRGTYQVCGFSLVLLGVWCCDACFSVVFVGVIHQIFVDRLDVHDVQLVTYAYISTGDIDVTPAGLIQAIRFRADWVSDTQQ